ncbi:uncharacterized protein CIMG_12204 [Coccidioides immitis RS]|uniref:Uncharacterized protein n=1 Tax=Coccidioides immitis (strain RS) TaxID=246410 RepID=A0A0D8JTS6_COCIM|nr:uncharacterized protein CIMG_12204 [Coccidioides immitis RS]KJF60740.1 hypothetical protein CIMG_12204 [Coccidioides immitis RS]
MKNSFCFITSSRTSRLLLRRKKRGVDLRPQALPARNVVSSMVSFFDDGFEMSLSRVTLRAVVGG